MKLIVTCTAEGCQAEAEVPNPPYDGIEPICAENNAGGSHFVLDTGWVSLPEGWQFAEGGERCPEHRCAGD